MMTINFAPLGKKLIVRSYRESDQREFNEIESRLMLLGFLEGENIRVVKRAPIFKAPFLVEVRGRMIALSESEAMLIQVEVTA